MEQTPWSLPQGNHSYRSSDAPFATSNSSISPPASSIGDGPRARFNSFQANSLNDSKSLINNGAQDDDDETGDILKDPIRFAESGSLSMHQTRRNTNPTQLNNVQRMASLSLNTNQNASTSRNGYTSPTTMQSPPPAMSPTMMTNGGPPMQFPPTNQHFQRGTFPPVNPADQNPPCNTLYVGNLPIDTSEDELKAMFSKQRGYKRLCFRTKQQSPLCFVEFADTTFATKALHELYGHPLHNSVKGGIRLSFSKNPLGVRSGQGPGAPGQQQSHVGMSNMTNPMNGMMASNFSTASGPPPGLSAPPGLGPSRVQYGAMSPVSNGASQYGNGAHYANGPYSGQFSSNAAAGWNTPSYSTTSMSSLNGMTSSSYNGSYSTGSGTTTSINGAGSPKHMSSLLHGGVTGSLNGAGSSHNNIMQNGNALSNGVQSGIQNGNGRIPGHSGSNVPPAYMMGR